MTSTPFKSFALIVLGILLAGQDVQGGSEFSRIRPGDNVRADCLSLEIRPDYAPDPQVDCDFAAIEAYKTLEPWLKGLPVSHLRKVFRHCKPPGSGVSVDLTRFYYVFFNQPVDLESALSQLAPCPLVERAEPVPIHRFAYTPNDPRLVGQWYIPRCNFPEAWDLSRGSPEVVIGLVDGGVDMNADEQDQLTIHEDLGGNLWVNRGEDINGDGVITWDDMNNRDDDHNGYIDDFHGWDMVGNDNWPDQLEGQYHGSFMAGIASAVTDNETGIAGAGFSCRIMVIGCANRQGLGIEDGPEGIIYCADNHANIINLSWGAIYQSYEPERRAIVYAQERGCIIFAAAGNGGVRINSNDIAKFHPAGYEGVIAVGATDNDDRRAVFNRTESSNYGSFIDICAPGMNMVSCRPHNLYMEANGGTSGAAALCSGLGALLLSLEPNLTAGQMLERMQQTAVDISALNQDFPGIDRRIDAGYLLGSYRPRLEVEAWGLQDSGGDDDGRAEPMENVLLPLTIVNRPGYADATEVRWRLETEDQYIRIDRSQGVIGNLAAGERQELEGNSAPRIYIRWNAHIHYSQVNLILTSAEGLEFRQTFPLTIGQPLYLLVDDDGGAVQDTFYVSDLQAMSRVQDTWAYAEENQPLQSWFNDYSFIIWETGVNQQPLTQTAQELLTDYLDSGGALILSSQYAGEARGGDSFFRNYLHARHLTDNVNWPQLNGVAGSSISDGVSLFLRGGGGANDNESPSSLEPLDEAQTIFTYANNSEPGGLYFANDVYQVIYLGFPLEAASGLAGSTPRTVVFERMLDYIYQVGVGEGEARVQPQDLELLSVWPNPFNSGLNLRVTLPETQPITLEAFDISGRLVDIITPQVYSAGAYIFSWDNSSMASGVYWIKLTAHDQVFTRTVLRLR
ncbi:MAG: S8 family serine peptidase [Calditrichota bacterium]